MHHVIQDAVDTKPDAKVAFVWLNVYVRRPAAKRIDHQHVHQTNDRSIFAGSGQRREIDLFVVFEKLKFLALMAAEIEPVDRNIEVGLVESLARSGKAVRILFYMAVLTVFRDRPFGFDGKRGVKNVDLA